MKQWLQLVAAALLSVFAALVTLGGILQATGNGSDRHDSRAGGVVLAVVFLMLLLACIRWAMHAEHAIRARNPRSPATAHALLPPPPGLRLRRPRRRYAPWALALVLLEFVGGFVACVVAAPVLHGHWTRTERVQQHGIAAIGTVTRVHNIRHTSKSSTWYTATVGVQLAVPVEGRVTTTAHFPHATGLRVGLPVRVLLDPRDGGYSEFQGYPAERRSGWIFVTVMAVVLGVLDLCFAWVLLRHSRYRRAFLSNAGLVSPASAPGV